MKLFPYSLFMYQQCLYTYIVRIIIVFLICLAPDWHITISLMILGMFCLYEQYCFIIYRIIDYCTPTYVHSVAIHSMRHFMRAWLTSFISHLIGPKWSKTANFANIFENFMLHQFSQSWLNILVLKAASFESSIVI